MKTIATILAYFLAFIVLSGSIFYGVRRLTNVSTPVTVTNPKPGVFCAVATTSDGVAISCWKEQQ